MSASHSSQSQSRQTLHDWLCYIEQSHPIEKIELGLERVRRVAAPHQLDQLPGQVILIAGTNGKGTTARTLEALLLAQGLRVGVYSSPHLLHFNERLRLNGHDVPDEGWLAGFERVEQARGDIPLTYFEFTTLVAFALLKQAEVDVCVIEVGLGGRLDATNIVQPTVSVITTVDLDHQDFLGPDRESIGFEKAGIFRAGVPAVVGDYDVPQSVLQHANALGSPLSQAEHDFWLQRQDACFSWHNASRQITNLRCQAIPAQNVATALQTLSVIGLLPPAEQVVKVLAELQLAGRMQWLSTSPGVLLDVAHNPQSACYLAEQLTRLATSYTAIHLVVGMLKDKDIMSALSPFTGHGFHWHLASLPGVRGASSDQLQAMLPSTETFEHIEFTAELRQRMRQSPAGELWVVFGSFVTVANMLALWHQEDV